VNPIYLDYLATTPVDPRVAAVMATCLTREGLFGNPASRSHVYGWRAEEAVENARAQVAALIGADARDIVWTSGATEADNMAILGLLGPLAGPGGHLVTSSIEHKAVLDCAQALRRSKVAVTLIAPSVDGLIAPAAVAAALRPDTRLVSVMHVNNELGTVNDVAAIGALCRDASVLFHTDAAQSAGKVPVDVESIQADMLALSAHKFYGPKGIGALWVRPAARRQLRPLLFGGGHERGLRPGTLATHQIVGMGLAAEIAAAEQAQEGERLLTLRERLWTRLSVLEGLTLNGHRSARIAGALNVSVAGVDGESLLLALSGIATSSGSACTSATLEPSYVLREIGVPDVLAYSSLRLSLGRFTTQDDVDEAAEILTRVISRLRASAA